MNPRAAPAVPFRLEAPQLQRAQALFNQRAEIRWFNFQGAFEGGSTAVIRFAQLHAGLQGGGGTAAINGGVIAAGFDAACVMTGLGHYATDTVVTVDLAVQFLALADASRPLAWQAWATRSTRNLLFVQAVLGEGEDVFATATAALKPVL
jgi:acyl-coenzyme A thioesterase PaaI-like protein